LDAVSVGLTVELASKVPAPRAEVWARVSTMAGVNQELGPWVRMTHPQEAASLADLEILEPGAVLFHSWLLVLGAVPFDRHALSLVELIDGEGFVEESTSWLQRRWRHERTLTSPTSDTTIVTDRVIVEPRVALSAPVVRAVVRAIFRHRHTRLRRQFGLVT
jgi:ligand-binding SRPBCC domain-containing protein